MNCDRCLWKRDDVSLKATGKYRNGFHERQERKVVNERRWRRWSHIVSDLWLITCWILPERWMDLVDISYLLFTFACFIWETQADPSPASEASLTRGAGASAPSGLVSVLAVMPRYAEMSMINEGFDGEKRKTINQTTLKMPYAIFVRVIDCRVGSWGRRVHTKRVDTSCNDRDSGVSETKAREGRHIRWQSDNGGTVDRMHGWFREHEDVLDGCSGRSEGQVEVRSSRSDHRKESKDTSAGLNARNTVVASREVDKTEHNRVDKSARIGKWWIIHHIRSVSERQRTGTGRGKKRQTQSSNKCSQKNTNISIGVYKRQRNRKHFSTCWVNSKVLILVCVHNVYRLEMASPRIYKWFHRHGLQSSPCAQMDAAWKWRFGSVFIQEGVIMFATALMAIWSGLLVISPSSGISRATSFVIGLSRESRNLIL